MKTKTAGDEMTYLYACSQLMTVAELRSWEEGHSQSSLLIQPDPMTKADTWAFQSSIAWNGVGLDNMAPWWRQRNSWNSNSEILRKAFCLSPESLRLTDCEGKRQTWRSGHVEKDVINLHICRVEGAILFLCQTSKQR